MTTLWRLVAHADLAALKAVAARLDDADPSPALAWSVFEDGPAPAGRLDVLFQDRIDADAFRQAFGLTDENMEVDYSPMPEEDWVRLSLEGLKPVEAGRFVLYGSHDADAIPDGLIGIEIEAGPAFGTGHHGTTKGCLLAFDAMLGDGVEPKTVFDLGCGTGALAIAAAKTLPGADIVMSDIDAESVEEAARNAAKNGAKWIEAVEADGFDHPSLAGRRFELIFANILAGPLIGLAPAITPALAPGGRVILSGLLTEQEAGVREAYEAQGLSVERREPLEGWETLIARKPDA